MATEVLLSDHIAAAFRAEPTVTSETPLGGMVYPYLAATKRRWAIESIPAESLDGGMRRDPLLRWINGSNVHDLFIDGHPFDPAALSNVLGLRLNMDNGGFRLSKRISRLMRPYRIAHFFKPDDVKITYLRRSAKRNKLYDGAGIVSRKFLLEMRRKLDAADISDRLRTRLQDELATCQRVEFTIQTRHGQDKGHAIVSEIQDADFVLIHDTKPEVQATDNRVFVGINPVHAHNHMRVDIQSLVNLRGRSAEPFWSNTQLLTWLHQSGATFLSSITTGSIDHAMQRIDSSTRLHDLEDWHVREYFASNGETLWFAAIVKTLINQHLKSIRASSLEHLRLPIPGGRYYVMPSRVGQDAGRSLRVRRGHVLLDADCSTAWLNDEDWLCLQDSPSGAGIARILGGADNDDALWCHPFIDHDEAEKLLLWRSPNQLGEYVVLRPEPGSEPLPWFDGQQHAAIDHNDSRLLPTRIDCTAPQYLNLVVEDQQAQPDTYSIDAMDNTIARITANSGALGMYCNLLLLVQALYEQQPQQPAARLEDVIDATVKNGNDLQPIKDYCYDASDKIVATGIAVPELLAHRLSFRRDEQRPFIPFTSHHWLDRLHAGIRDHIAFIQEQRDRLMRQAQPPHLLFQYAIERDLLAIGGQLNALYADAINDPGDLSDDARYELARALSEGFIVHASEQASPEDIVLGALASSYLNHSSDAAVWQPGAVGDDDAHRAGIAQLTLDALRSIGILADLRENRHGRVSRYPTIAPALRTSTIQLNGVWFNYLLAKGYHYERLGDVDEATAQAAKDDIANLAQFDLQNYVLTLVPQSDRLLAYGPNGKLFGYVARDHADRITSGKLIVRAAQSRDGNLIAICDPA